MRRNIILRCRWMKIKLTFPASRSVTLSRSFQKTLSSKLQITNFAVEKSIRAPNVARARVRRRAGVVGQAATAPLYGDDNWDIERRKQFQTSNL